jgi:hypothetical protein
MAKRIRIILENRSPQDDAALLRAVQDACEEAELEVVVKRDADEPACETPNLEIEAKITGKLGDHLDSKAAKAEQSSSSPAPLALAEIITRRQKLVRMAKKFTIDLAWKLIVKFSSDGVVDMLASGSDFISLHGTAAVYQAAKAKLFKHDAIVDERPDDQPPGGSGDVTA